ncbi:MAG: ribosome maturation factor RimM [Desulfitobacteriia bacterium]
MDKVVIGEVLKPQGIKGEMKVYPLTDDPRRFEKLEKIYLAGQSAEKQIEIPFKIQNVRLNHQGIVFIKLEGIQNPEEAEKYRGFLVKIDKKDVPPLEDRWYYFELEGMKVYEKNNFLGTLVKVLETGANDVYVVQGEKGQVCIPALKSVVQKVDVPGKRMDVLLPPGLID